MPEELKPDLDMRPARASDIEALNESMPSSINNAQMSEQENGNTTFLLALDGDEPVGRLVVRWGGTAKDEIRRLVPNTPNISMVRTREDRRGRGIGTNLMHSAEELAHARGYEQVGLGVAIENETARRLYEQLGYEDWGHGTYMHTRRKPGPNGEVEQEEIYLIKRLRKYSSMAGVVSLRWNQIYPNIVETYIKLGELRLNPCEPDTK